jgi:hypothetical protein
MLQRFCKSGVLLILGALIGAMLFDVVSSTGQDARGTVVASYHPEPFAAPHAGLDVIWNHFQR